MLSGGTRSRARCCERGNRGGPGGRCARREEGYALNTLGSALSGLGEPRRPPAPRAGAGDRRGGRQHRRHPPGLRQPLGGPGLGSRLERAAEVGRAGIARAGVAGLRRGRGHVALLDGRHSSGRRGWAEAECLAVEAVAAIRQRLHRVVQPPGARRDRRPERRTRAAARAPRRGPWAVVDRRRRLRSRARRGARSNWPSREGRLDERPPLVDQGLSALAGSDAQDSLQRFVALGLRAEADEACTASRARADGRTVALERAERLIAHSRAMQGDLARRGVPLTHRSAVLRPLCRGRVRAGPRTSTTQRSGRRRPDGWAEPRAALRVGVCAPPRGRGSPRRRATRRRRQARRFASVRRRVTASARAAGAEIEALARRARVRLAAAGADTGDASTRPAPASAAGRSRCWRSWRRVTPTARSRRQLYISEKTASAHVSHILTKLRVANRSQATAAAHRLKLVPDPRGG